MSAHGQRVPTVTHAAEYVLPNDEAEQDRLDLQYHSIRIVLDDKHFLSPLEKPQSILDVGTGTGIWAMDVGERRRRACRPKLTSQAMPTPAPRVRHAAHPPHVR